MTTTPPADLSAVLTALERAFSGQEHDFIHKGELNASPSREERLRRVLDAGLHRLSDEDLDWLMSTSLTTVGGTAGFAWLLPRFLKAALTSQRDWYTSADHILSRLERAEFDSWPPRRREAVLDALDAWSAIRQARAAASPYEEEDEGATDIELWVADKRGDAGPQGMA